MPWFLVITGQTFLLKPSNPTRPTHEGLERRHPLQPMAFLPLHTRETLPLLQTTRTNNEDNICFGFHHQGRTISARPNST